MLVLTLLCMASLASTSCAAERDERSPIASVSEAHPQHSSAGTSQRRNDRVVGYWTSSTGDAVILAYSGNAETFWIQVYPNPDRSDPRLDYTANWMSDDEFWFVDSSGRRMSGRVAPSGQTIALTDTTGLRTRWTRNR